MNVCVNMGMKTANVSSILSHQTLPLTGSVIVGKSTMTHTRLSVLSCKMIFTADFIGLFEC